MMHGGISKVIKPVGLSNSTGFLKIKMLCVYNFYLEVRDVIFMKKERRIVLFLMILLQK